jgi:hypothetical protein
MRTRPYTAIGIKRVPCSRCGKPSHASWQVCADLRQYRGVCKRCDIELNRMVLEFMKINNRKSKMREYIRGMEK